MVKSVVATGKVEPITKIEIKSKANGIIKVLNADVDRAVKAGDILVELDREQLAAALRGAEANLQAARASLEGAEAQLKKNIVEAEGPDEQFARRAYERAQTLFGQNLIAQSALDDAHSLVDVAENRKRAAQSQLAIGEAKVTEARAQVAQAKAAADRAAEDVANATIRAPIRGTVLSARRRDRQPGVVDPESGRQRHARHDARRHRTGVRARQGRRGRHRPRASRSGRPASASKPSRTRCSTARSRRSRRWASRRTTSPTSRCGSRSTIPGKELKANMTANAEIVLEEHPDALIVPEAAVTYDAQKNAFVEVVAAGRQERPQESRRSSSASATAPRSRSSTASSRATRSSCRRSG